MLKLPSIECISDPNVTKVYARLRRHDGQYYNPATKSFDDNVNNQIPMVRGTGPESNVWRMATPFEVSPEFTPGRYTVYYHDDAKLCGAVYEDVDSDEVVVISPKIPTADEIASRVSTIQTVEGSLKTAINNIVKDLNEVLAIVKTVGS